MQELLSFSFRTSSSIQLSYKHGNLQLIDKTGELYSSHFVAGDLVSTPTVLIAREPIISVSQSLTLTYFITEKGTLYFIHKKPDSSYEAVVAPRQIELPFLVKGVYCGKNKSYCLNEEGKLYTLENDAGMQFTYELISFKHKIKTISCGYGRIMVLTEEGEVYTRTNIFRKNRASDNNFVRKHFLGGDKIVQIACGSAYSYVLDACSRLHTIVSDGAFSLEKENKIIALSGDAETTAFITEDGKLYLRRNGKGLFALVKSNCAVVAVCLNSYSCFYMTSDDRLFYVRKGTGIELLMRNVRVVQM